MVLKSADAATPIHSRLVGLYVMLSVGYDPAGTMEQLLAAAPEYRPTTHREQLELPAEEYEPAAHDSQAGPPAELYLPAIQSWQCPVLLVNCP